MERVEITTGTIHGAAGNGGYAPQCLYCGFVHIISNSLRAAPLTAYGPEWPEQGL